MLFVFCLTCRFTRNSGVITFNLTFFPAPSIEEICETIARVTKVKEPEIVVSPNTLKFAAGLLYSAAKILGKRFNGVHPDRVKKLMVSTNVSGEKLSKTRYRLRYTLEESINDWFNECEKKGLF